MAIQFIIGRAGTGKTSICLNSILDRARTEPIGPPIWWIVPRQMTLQAQRMLVTSEQVEGVCRVQVGSFEYLAEAILSEAGGAATPRLSMSGRQMVIAHLLHRHADALKHFRSSARQIGLAAEIDRAFEELERNAIDPQTLPDTAARLAELSATGEPLPAAVSDKLHDLALLYRAYDAFIGTNRLDPHRRLQQVLELIDRCPSLQGVEVFADGFVDLTAFEQQILVHLAAGAKMVRITLPIDAKAIEQPDSAAAALFARPLRSYHALLQRLHHAKVAVAPPTLLGASRRFQRSSLAWLERQWEQQRAQPGDIAGIELIEATTRRDEVAAAARWIRARLADGMRLRDIAVLVRSVRDYADLVDAVFREHDLPAFIDRRRTARHHPLVQLLRGILRVLSSFWPSDAVLAIARCGLTAITLDDADQLENYILDHRLGPGAWRDPAQWQFTLRRTHAGVDADADSTDEPNRELRNLESLRSQLVDPLIPLFDHFASQRELPVRTMVASLLECFDRFGARQRLASMVARARLDTPEVADEHQAVWKQLMELFDQLVDLLGDELLPPQRLIDLIEYGLEQFDLALAPPTVDQILVGDVDRSRLPPIKACVVIGLNEGQFPIAPSENAILGDVERARLRDVGASLDPNTHELLADEEYLGYVSMTRASERLLLTRSLITEGGRPTAPGAYWRRARALLPSLTVTPAPPSPGTAAEAVRCVTDWLSADDLDPDAASAGWYELLRTTPAAPVAKLRDLALGWLDRRRAERLPSSLAANLFPAPLFTSVSRVEAFASCPYRHFAAYGLQLETRPDPEVTALDLGNIGHATLEQVVRGVLRDHLDWCDTALPLEQAVDGLADAAAEELRSQLLLSDGRSRYLLERMKRMIRATVESQRRLAALGRFRPSAVELKFGRHADLPPLILDTPLGQVVLRGKIDRIDLLDDASRFAVIDYKLSARELKGGYLRHGLALQLLAYLAVVQEAGGPPGASRKGATAAAALYVPMMREIKSVDHPTDAIAPTELEFHAQPKVRGVATVTSLPLLDQSSEGNPVMLSGKLLKSGTPSGDVVPDETLTTLLRFVRERLAELGAEILSGVVGTAPFYDNGHTPCAHCPYNAVCRFEPWMGGYQPIRPVSLTALASEFAGTLEDRDVD